MLAERAVEVLADVVLALAGQRPAVADHVGVGRDHVARLVGPQPGRVDRQPGHRRDQVGEDRVLRRPPRRRRRPAPPARRAPPAPAPRRAPPGPAPRVASNASVARAASRSGLTARRGTEAWPARPWKRRRSALTSFSPTEIVTTRRPSARSRTMPPPSSREKSKAQVGALADQPGHADVGGVVLLVGLGDQQHVAGRPLAGAGEGGEGGGARRQLVLHVGGAAADQPAVLDPALERRHAPALGRRRDDVGVGAERDRGPVAACPRSAPPG